MPFPFEGEVGKASQMFRNFYDQVSAWSREGFKVMGITPYPRGWQGVTMPVIYKRCTGLDVHKKTVTACRREGRKRQEIKSFGTTTLELLE